MAFAESVNFWSFTSILRVSLLKPAISATTVNQLSSWKMSISGLGSLRLSFPNFFGRWYLLGWMASGVLNFWTRRALGFSWERGFKFVGLNHFRRFLLLRHFALMLCHPEYKGNFNRGYKTYRTWKNRKNRYGATRFLTGLAQNTVVNPLLSRRNHWWATGPIFVVFYPCPFDF